MKNNLFYSLCSAIAGIGLTIALSAPAQAFTFGTQNTGKVGNVGNFTSVGTVGINETDIGKSFRVNWSLPAAGTHQAMAATGLFKVNSLTSSALNLTVKLTNTTAPSFQAALMSLGIGVANINRASASYTTVGSKFDGMVSGSAHNGNFPGGFKNVDVCIFAANGCNGGNINQGLQSGGETDTFTFSVAGNFGAKPSVTLDSFAAKFQTSAGSFEFPGVEIKDEPPPPPKPRKVPEPAMATGAIAALIAARRRQAK